MADEGHLGNGLPPGARERLERIVVELFGIAAECEGDRATRQKLMQLADQISTILEE